jgi:hypothetical protein
LSSSGPDRDGGGQPGPAPGAQPGPGVSDDQMDATAAESDQDPQRGEDPPRTVGGRPDPDPGPDPDPAWQPPPGRVDTWQAAFDRLTIKHRPRREVVLPYLLVRALTSGDRGRRALWPPAPCWESPDILLIDAGWSGPFDPSQLVASPTAGRSYRVFVHVWNLGLVPAVGVHVRAWWVRPGFFGQQTAVLPEYQPALIGGSMIDLSHRRSPDCHQLVELDRPWTIPADVTGHECLIASASCPADPWAGAWAPNDDRHVALRNLTIRAGTQNLRPLLQQLLRALPADGAVHITHGGEAAGPLLQAVAGGRVLAPTQNDPTRTVAVRPARLDELSAGVVVGNERHIATIIMDNTTNNRSLVVPSDRLEALFAEQGWPSPFADLPHLPRNVLQLPPEVLGPMEFHPTPLILGWLLSSDLVSVEVITSALRGPPGAQHLLRFTLTDLAGGMIGGYSLVVL